MKRAKALCLVAAAAAAAALFAVPGARLGALALLNRVFAASEAANAYAYEYFPVPAGQGIALAAALLGVFFAAVLALAFLLSSGALLLGLALFLCGAQAYFGLALPAWANLLAFSALGFRLGRRAFTGRAAIAFAAAVALIVGAVLLLWPGVDAATEAASERVRDRLASMAQSLSGEETGASGETIETRRVNPRSLLHGDSAALRSRAFRLVTIEQERVAKPRWLDLARVFLLLLASAALVAAPFAPFFLLSARARRARALRAPFSSEDRAEAIRAMFRHCAAYLSACGMDGGNALYRDWTPILEKRLPGEYVRLYGECAEIFEEAAYGARMPDEEKRERTRLLLEETERLLYDGASRRQKLRLRYGECLHL